MSAGTIKLSSGIRSKLRGYSMFFALFIIAIVFAILTQGINLTPRNFSNILAQNGYILILAVGMVMVIITGNIDLSVGSVAAFTGAVSAIVYNTGIGLIPTIVITLALGAIIGASHGAAIAYFKMPSFIVTLVGMLLYRGLTYIVTHVTPITPKGDSYKDFANSFVHWEANDLVFHTSILIVTIVVIALVIFFSFLSYSRKKKLGMPVRSLLWQIVTVAIYSIVIAYFGWNFMTYRGIPSIMIILAVVVGLFVFVTNRTVFGRYIYAVGGNYRAAKLSGINSEATVFWVFTLMGTLTGLAALAFTGYMNSALPQSGNLFELDAIAAVFVGGASAQGGVGSVMGAIIGGLVMGIINNGMSLINLGSEYQYVVKAMVLFLAVLYDVYTRSKS